MRKIIFGGANSLDNYFARKDHSVDWLMWSDEAAEIMKEMWPRFDTMLMGRRTYEVSLRMTKGKTKSNPFGDIKTYIFSRTMEKEDHPEVEIISENAVEFVRDLKGQDGKDIMLMGGGNLAKTFLEAGLIDEIGFNIHPVLLGAGIPLFYEMERQIDLELIECRQFKNGCVYVLYNVKNASGTKL